MNNPTAEDAAFFSLPDRRIITLAGRDAIAFAQAQLMNDVRGLHDGSWQWNGWLTPKGRVIALFALLRVDAETLWLVVDDVDPSALVEQLKRFVFRSKVVISLADGLHVGGAFQPLSAASASVSAVDPAGVTELDMGADCGQRTLAIRGDVAYAADSNAATRWHAFDLAHGLPSLAADQRERWTPQQLSLQCLNAYSVRKGCYPGQEIVARTHFLGQAKRALVRLQLDGPTHAGEDVTFADAVVGAVVDAAEAADGAFEALAILPTAQAGPCLVGFHAAHSEPLLQGLGR